MLLGVSFELLAEATLGFRTLLPGAVLGGVGLWAVQLVGGTLRRAGVVADTSDIYGTFATVFGLLIWLRVARPSGAHRERDERRVAPSRVAANVPALGHPTSPEG